MKKALITGITGQDGSLLAELLLSKGYSVSGTGNPRNMNNLAPNLNAVRNSIKICHINIADSDEMSKLIRDESPDEIYNLAAQSNSVEAKRDPAETALLNGFVVVAMLKAVREYCPKTRFFQASSSEIFGRRPVEYPQNEKTVCMPDNPYSISKYFAHQMVRYYREQEQIFACSGILYNHESIRRKSGFLTRKIIQGVSAIKQGKESHIILGNLDAVRDWGSAEDYVEAMYLMMQAEKPDDYVIATGVAHSVREFVEKAFHAIGIAIEWRNHGLQEVGLDACTGVLRVKVSPDFYREQENEHVLGNPEKIYQAIGWKAGTSLDSLIEGMVKEEQSYGLL